MNENLMKVVERAVRPVRAGRTRKFQMRQELLAHLTALYEDELERLKDESRAFAVACERFGDPRELSRDLQASVPLLDRWEGHLLALLLRWPRERASRHALRLATLMAALTLGALILFPLVRVAAGDDWSDTRVGLAPMLVITGCMFLSVLMGYGLCRELTDRLGAAALIRGAAYGAGAVLAGVALVVGEYVAQPENPLWEFILCCPGDPLALSVGVWFTGMPLALALVAVLVVRREMARDREYGDWTSLEIGE